LITSFLFLHIIVLTFHTIFFLYFSHLLRGVALSDDPSQYKYQVK
jgi:hypothetical protein